MSLIAMLDVESFGLYGKAISFGIVVGNTDGKIIEEVYECHYDEADAIWRLLNLSQNETDCVKKNVIPNLGESTCKSLYQRFFETWNRLKTQYQHIDLWADVPFPVETNFIANVAELYAGEDVFSFSPYPLLDVCSYKRAKGLYGSLDRIENELPEHNALNDARNSFRALIQAMKIQ